MLSLVSVSVINCQNSLKMKTIHSLPNIFEEISGFESTGAGGLLWSVNDSGNEAKLYGYNPVSNKIDRSIAIENGSNVDWEDVAADPDGNIYIGDFGNNSNKRKDLVIYRIAPDSIKGKVHTAEKIRFRYEDQKKFPPKRKDRNFDVEAFIYYRNSLYLFTKNRSSKFDGTTNIYSIPPEPGNHTATLIGSYKTCEDQKKCIITGASINKDRDMIALLGYDKVWLLSEFEGDDFFGGKVEQIVLRQDTQTESISFKNDSTLYIADERTGIHGGNLYEVSLK